MANTRDETQKNAWVRFGMRLAVSTACHPLEYAKILIQIGYEPIAPRPTTTLLGKPTLALPNVFQYVSHIKRIDGLSGCYRGLVPKLMGNLLSLASSERIADRLGLIAPVEKEDEQEEDLTEYDRRKRFEQALSRDMVLHITGIVVSQPFQVITVRMMAQFVGREVKYNSLLGSICEIYREEGLAGFFSGLFPRLLGDLACLLFASAVTYVINKHLVQDRETRGYVGAIATFITSTVMYPFQVVSNCMAVTGSGLAAGTPPHMPNFQNWQECWSYLRLRGELKRGSSLLWRYYRPPVYQIDGVPSPKIEVIKKLELTN